jgi:hypothetical protein
LVKYNISFYFSGWAYNYIFGRLLDIPSETKTDKFYKVLWLTILVRQMSFTDPNDEQMVDVFIERCKVANNTTPDKKKKN